MLKAAVIMTGDDHANGGTAGRFNDYVAFSTPGCSVADWQCIRGTSYIYPNTQITDAQVQNYVTQGFEIAVHVNTNCLDWTAATLPGFYSNQLTQFAIQFPSAGAPKTNRTHCVVNSDYATQWQVSLNNGIRLDTNYYYFPGAWVLDRPGMFTGSGMPQRFTSSTGQMIDVYQAATQMTDESAQTFPMNANVLLDNAINLGYYGAFTANMHTDFNPSNGQTWSNAIVGSAMARNVPVITARQMLDWLDGRNASTFQSIAWSANVLSFNISVGSGATGLHALVPAVAGSGSISGITLNGASVPYTTQTIKGVSYAAFAAGAGAYQVAYGADIVPPAISAVSVAPGRTTATVAWTTDEPSGSTVSYGTSAGSLGSNFGNSVLVTAHNLTLPSLTPGTQYFYRVSSADAASNSSTSPVPPATATFTTTASIVSGTITPAATGSGATVTLTGGASPVTVTADAFGNYQFSNVLNGSFTVTPAKTGYAFTPANRAITVSGADVTAQNFTVQPVTITGTVTPAAGGNGATLTLTGTASATATADVDGEYTFSTLPNGSYTVTPSKAGFTFSPSSRAVTISGASVATVDFTATAVPTFTVTGTVTPAASGSGATLTLSGTASATATANGSGVYSFGALSNGSYTVTPSKTGFTFSPSFRTFTISGANVTAVDFTATTTATFSVSGTISPVAGGSFAQVGIGASSVSADGSGNYTFPGLSNGTYTATPVKPGYVFSPNGRAVTVNGANVTGVNFTAQPVTISGTITPAANGSGATLTISVAGGITATVDAAGAFTLSGVPDGTYTLTPVKSGFTFTPPSQSVTVSNRVSVSGVAFTAAAATSSAIIIDVTNTAGRSARGPSIVSGTFSTTAGNELLLAFVEASNNDATPTVVNTVTGGGLAWVFVRRTNTQRGTAEIWRAFTPAVLTGASVTANLSQWAAAAITVMSFRGVDTTGTSGSGAVGATGGASAPTGAPSASLVTTRANSLVLGNGNDWDGMAARTLGAGQTLVGQFLGTDGDTFWVQRTTNTVAAAGTSVTINDTAPANHQVQLDDHRDPGAAVIG